MSNKNNTTTGNNNNQPSKEKEGTSQLSSPEVIDLEKIISALTSEYINAYMLT
jgi:hypothetical protein